MRVQVDKYVKQRTEIEIDGITLLSTEEAGKIPREILAIGDWWFLRSPGVNRYNAAYVYSDGSVNMHGFIIDNTNGVVRPALKISNQESANLRIDDMFSALGYDWIYVLDGIALCNSSIGYHRFDEASNDWEKSELKDWLENWFAKEMGKNKIKGLPSIQPGQKTAYWVKMSDSDGIYYCCSECGEELYREWSFNREFDLFPKLKSIDRTRYCPNCGTKMEIDNG